VVAAALIARTAPAPDTDAADEGCHRYDTLQKGDKRLTVLSL
jgi:hypothetical protein